MFALRAYVVATVAGGAAGMPEPGLPLGVLGQATEKQNEGGKT